MKCSLIALVVLTATVLLGGCGAKGDCEKTADHVMALTTSGLAEDVKAKLAKTHAEQRAVLIDECKREGLSKSQEECILKAENVTEVAACNGK